MVRRWMAVGLALVAIIVGGVAAWGFIQFNRIDRVGVDLAAAAKLEPQNFLVVGSDTRELGDKGLADDGAIYGGGGDKAPGGKRADTIVIARLDPAKATIELLSVPRDLWITSDGKEQRINGSYNDGPQNLVDTIQENLGIPINHYVEVNFNGFKGLVDALQGVPLYFDRPVRDQNTGLNIKKKGCYTLDGVQALAFARSRHMVYSDGAKWISDPSGDLGRITRQQVFLRHALGKVSKMGLDDVDSLRVLTGVAVNNVTIDDTLGTKDIIDLARKFASFDASQMVVHRLSTQPMKTGNGSDVLQMSEADSQAVLDIFSGKAPSTAVPTVPTTVLGPANVTVDVLNGAGVNGLARKSADRLASVGFGIGAVETGDRTNATEITYGGGAEAQAKVLASTISPEPAVKADADLGIGKVVITLAADLDVPGSSATPGASVTAATTPAPTTVPTSGAGTVTPEKTLGLNIGDPPPGMTCAT